MSKPITHPALEYLKKTKPVLIDTNILYSWMPIPGSNTTSGTSGDVLKELIIKKVPIFINSHVVSEYINLYLRTYAKEHPNEFNGVDVLSNYGFKHNFRNTEKYNEIIKEVVTTLYYFLDQQGLTVQYVDTIDNLSKSTLELMTRAKLDFTDAVLVQIASEKGAAILSNDKDFSKLDLPNVFSPTILTL
ncbi:hypothetical protein FOL01_0114 [Weissella jogaejeotgali]|uniref:PIN domain-containing protein n=1 Tax=Weissella jogaejeotgali TaxID=1631871 RepID=A0A1L6R8Y1_9LACO|nr:type II toxin-antitoxin system VapC family toxin [Weissella jogaejeotgali]APS40973.1 hypothetical protein FOL01_0114 [Weissella jogaejeotgali]